MLITGLNDQGLNSFVHLDFNESTYLYTLGISKYDGLGEFNLYSILSNRNGSDLVLT